jgi:hypothetical protein
MFKVTTTIADAVHFGKHPTMEKIQYHYKDIQ